MYQKVVLVGNLTRDITLRYAQSGTAIASTGIATSRKFTANGEKKEEVMFMDLTFFGRSGEVANQYLRKGSKILVEGRLVYEQWVDNSGQKRSKHSLTVETMQMLDTRNSSAPHSTPNEYTYGTPASEPHPDQSDNQYNTARNQNQAQKQHQQEQKQPSMGQDVPDIDVDEDEIPF